MFGKYLVEKKQGIENSAHSGLRTGLVGVLGELPIRPVGEFRGGGYSCVFGVVTLENSSQVNSHFQMDFFLSFH